MKKLLSSLALIGLCASASAQGPVYSGGFIVKDSKGNSISGDDGAFNLLGTVNIVNNLVPTYINGGQLLATAQFSKALGPVTIGTGLNYNPATATLSSTVAGTVTSVGLSLPAELTVSGSPVTGAGTLTGVWANENANVVFAGPSSGAPAVPGFRALSPADIPTIGTSAFGSPLPGFIHFAAFTPYPTVAAPVGVGSQWSQSGQLQFNATATTAAFVQYNTATTNSQVGFGDSSTVIPGPWTAGLTLNVHAVVAITNIATQRTVIGFSSQISPASPTQLSSVDAPLVGTNAVYMMASTNNSHWQLVTSDGSGTSTTTPSTVALANNTLVTLDLVGSTPGGSYVMYINGTPAATNSTHLPIASIPIAFVTSGRFYVGQYALNVYGMAIWQAFQ